MAKSDELSGMKKAVGLRIKTARVAKGLTQEQLCELVPGLKSSTLSNYEVGIREPDIWMIKKLAECLYVTPGYLLTLEDAPPPPPPPQLQALIQCYEKSDERGKANIMRIAELESHHYEAMTQERNAYAA